MMEEEESLLMIFHYWYFTVLKINVVHMSVETKKVKGNIFFTNTANSRICKNLWENCRKP